MPNDILWPMRGVVRRDGVRTPPGFRGPWPAPWAVNVRVEDNIDRRLRGGSRPGLTKFVNDHMGSVIADMIAVNVSSADEGANEILFVMVDSGIKTVLNGTTTTQVAYLTDGSGNILTDAAGNRLVVSTGTAPAAGFLVAGQQKVFAVTTSGIVSMDPKTGEAGLLPAVSGTIPTNCEFGAIYRDRMCLSGKDNAIYMSRQGVYADFNFGVDVTDQARAIPFQLSLASDVGAKCKALIPCMDQYMICGTRRSLWVIQEDPGAAGSLRRISETVGIIGPKCWVKTDSAIVFLAEDGLYQVQADGSGLTPLSPNRIPAELRDTDLNATTVSLGYEADRATFHIYLKTAAGSDTHWAYEAGAQAFWPMRLQNGHSPRAVCQHKGDLLLAGTDGYIRKVTGDNDDGAAIQSHVVMGPFRLSALGHFGRMINLHASLAAGGGSVNWRIVTGATAEEAADNAKTAIEAFQSGGSYASLVKQSGNWTSGRSIMVYPRVRAMWFCVWLQSTNKWAFEGMLVNNQISLK